MNDKRYEKMCSIEKSLLAKELDKKQIRFIHVADCGGCNGTQMCNRMSEIIIESGCDC